MGGRSLANEAWTTECIAHHISEFPGCDQHSKIARLREPNSSVTALQSAHLGFYTCQGSMTGSFAFAVFREVFFSPAVSTLIFTVQATFTSNSSANCNKRLLMINIKILRYTMYSFCRRHFFLKLPLTIPLLQKH